MSIEYEWCVETVASSDDEIEDSNHPPSFEECMDDILRNPPDAGEYYQLVLVRDKIDPFDGVIDRDWAYLSDESGEAISFTGDLVSGGLPALVSVVKSARIPQYPNRAAPKRFHEEVRRWVAKHDKKGGAE